MCERIQNGGEHLQEREESFALCREPLGVVVYVLDLRVLRDDVVDVAVDDLLDALEELHTTREAT